MSKEIEQLTLKAGIAINNSLQNLKLQEMLDEYGYTTEKLTEGKSLLQHTIELDNVQAKEYGEQYQATNDLLDKKDAANKSYIKFIKIARIAMPEEPAAWQALALWGERKESVPGWLAQAKQFYTNLSGNHNWLQKMAVYGITNEKLAEGEALVTQVEEALNTQKKEMGEAQEATRLRGEAVDILKAWYSDFIAIARIALEDKPQYLEMLGIIKK